MGPPCGTDASGAPSAWKPRPPRSAALVLALARLSRGQAPRAASLRAARVHLAQLALVATPPKGPRRGGAKMVHAISWVLRRSPEYLRYCFITMVQTKIRRR